MNKTAIKNFAIWARNKLIADISYKAGHRNHAFRHRFGVIAIRAGVHNRLQDQ